MYIQVRNNDEFVGPDEKIVSTWGELYRVMDMIKKGDMKDPYVVILKTPEIDADEFLNDIGQALLKYEGVQSVSSSNLNQKITFSFEQPLDNLIEFPKGRKPSKDLIESMKQFAATADMKQLQEAREKRRLRMGRKERDRV
jgi:hypothetical protein